MLPNPIFNNTGITNIVKHKLSTVSKTHPWGNNNLNLTLLNDLGQQLRLQCCLEVANLAW